MLLEAWRDPSGTGHTIYARLVDARGIGLSNQAVTLTVNGTAYTQQTNNTGYVTLHLTLQPGDASANNYQVMATFNGTNPRSANITALDPYGDQYALCTTNQYDLSPSTNSSTLSVLLQSTDAITAAKTMEQARQKAKDKGWLNVYDEWGWWYPWYRLHYRITVGHTTKIDAGVSLLPGGSTQSSEGLEIFNQLNEAFVTSFMEDAASLMGEYALAKIGFWCAQPWVTAFFLGLEFLEDLGVLYFQWNNKGEMLAFGVVNIIMGFVATQGGFATAFLSLMTGVNAPAMAALTLISTSAIAAGGPSVANPIDWIEVGMSFGFAALALANWAGLM